MRVWHLVLIAGGSNPGFINVSLKIANFRCIVPLRFEHVLISIHGILVRRPTEIFLISCHEEQVLFLEITPASPFHMVPVWHPFKQHLRGANHVHDITEFGYLFDETEMQIQLDPTQLSELGTAYTCRNKSKFR